MRASHTFWQDHSIYLLYSSDVKKAFLSLQAMRKEIILSEKFFQLKQSIFLWLKYKVM